MNKGRPFRKRKLNNDGSTLIVVLVAVSFLLIIAAIVMTVSSANVRMKQIEYATKQNFYVDEIGLDDVYNGIGKEVSKALSRAYAKTLIDATASGKYNTQKAAYGAFAGFLKTELINLYGEDVFLQTTLDKLNGYISRSKSGESLEVISYSGIEILADPEIKAPAGDGSGADIPVVLWQYILKDVKVKYIEADRYESVITTDIVIEVPYINFFQDFSHVLDYSLIGNKGIYFKGTEGADAQAYIEGNVYAGIDTDRTNNATYMGYVYGSTPYDGMNFYKSVVKFKDSSYIVSKGDINICESAVTIESELSSLKEAQSNLWAENIRTVENGKSTSPVVNASLTPSVLNATANVFAADDLELNARNSSVTVKGNYYGYNFNNSTSTYETWENKNLKDKYSTTSSIKAANTTSSSILVNGMNSTLDLREVNTLMVAGVAYVDIKDSDKSYAAMANDEAREYRTGESISVRYNQFMYLAPAEILNGVSNPQQNGSTNGAEVCPSANNVKLTDWFGQEFLDTSGESPVIPVVYSDGGTSYTYYYLKIKSGMEEAYVNSFMSAGNPGSGGNAMDKQKWELQQEIKKKAAASGIASLIIPGGGGSTKIYTTGLLTDTSTSVQTLKENGMSTDVMATRSATLQKRYAQLYVNLDPNSLESVEDSKKSSSDYPLKAFLNTDAFSGMVSLSGKKVEGVKDAGVWISTGLASTELNLSSQTQKGIVLCEGDLTITGNGGTFEGLIIATGKIKVEGNVIIKANRGVVQAVLEAEQRSVMELDEEVTDAEDVELNEFASHYFLNTVLTDITELDPEDIVDMDKRVTSTEYTDYIYYNNWRKGEVSVSP